MNVQRILQTITAPASAADTYGDAIATDLARTYSYQVTPVTALGTITGNVVVQESNDGTNWTEVGTAAIAGTEPTLLNSSGIYGAFIRVGFEITANDTETDFTVHVILKD